MKHSEIYLSRERLVVNFSQSEQKGQNSKLLSALNRIWQHLLTILTKGNELQVWQTSDRFW